MSPLVRLVLFTSLLTAASWASAEAQERPAEPKTESPREDAKANEPAKGDAKPADTPERPPAANDAPAGAPDSPPATNNAAAPARDAAKPARPAGKQRPAWPPPPELIS